MRSLLLCIFLLIGLHTWGHIGSPNVCFEGKAGPFPVRVSIRPPGVVPGLAEINVRVLSGNARRVTALPVYWDAGREGAPPPDVAEPVRGETNLYSTSLWLMMPGAYSVDVTIEGQQGVGTITVPVDSVATARNTMQPWFTIMLAAIGTLLFLGGIKLFGAAFGEAIMEPGAEFAKRLRWRARFAMVGGTIFWFLLLLIGKGWWDLDDRDYRNNRLYKPVPVNASVRFEQRQPIMRLMIDDWTPLIPDHGKLMHLFMVREPELDAFAHLHPVQVQPKTFDVPLPPLPKGLYTIYADVTRENGSADTLTNSIQISEWPDSFTQFWQMKGNSDAICSSSWWLNLRTNLFLAPDPDDAWHVDRPSNDRAAASSPNGQQLSRLANDYTMVWQKDGELLANREASLKFKLLSREELASLEPYMGMFGHAVVRREDGAVFAHVHPVGTFSMASQQVFLQRESTVEGTGQSRSEKLENITHTIASASHTNHSGGTNTISAVSFPYEFPRPGPYRIWVQLKSKDRVFTGVFDTEVRSKK